MSTENHHTFRHVQYLTALAYGLFLAITSVALWGGYTSFLKDTFYTENVVMLDFLVRGLAFPLCLASLGVGAYFSTKIITRINPAIPTALLLLGALIIFLMEQFGFHSIAMLAVSSACFGIGSGLYFALFQHVIASQKVFSVGIMVIAAAGISALVYFVLAALPDNISLWVVFLVLVPLCMGLLWYISHNTVFTHPMYKTAPKLRMDRCRAVVGELWRPLLAIALSAFIIGLVRAQVIFDSSFLSSINTMNMLGLLVACLALLITWSLLYSKLILNRIYQIIFPLTATAFLLLPFLRSQYQYLFIAFSFTVFSITSSLMVISCIRAARNHCLQPVFVYGIFAGCVYGVSFIGSVVGAFFGSSEGFGFTQLLGIALVAVYVLSITLFANRNGKAKSEFAKPLSGLNPGLNPENSIDATAMRCDFLQTQYDLSDREAEVLLLAARGRDVPYIAEELCISANTVRTHCKSIYSKIGVHSKQELLTLVEETEL